MNELLEKLVVERAKISEVFHMWILPPSTPFCYYYWCRLILGREIYKPNP
jgi:hypothetical protein